jgi:hypothetical protein
MFKPNIFPPETKVPVPTHIPLTGSNAAMISTPSSSAGIPSIVTWPRNAPDNGVVTKLNASGYTYVGQSLLK